jgi:hypothetical protein
MPRRRLRSIVIPLFFVVAFLGQANADACRIADPRGDDARACIDAAQAANIPEFPDVDSLFRHCLEATMRRVNCVPTESVDDDAAEAYIYLGASFYRQSLARSSDKRYGDPDGFARTGIAFAERALRAANAQPNESGDERVAPLRFLLLHVLTSRYS